MQRRYAIIAAVALAALVLIPAAALALGPGGGFGHRGDGPGQKNASATAPAWAGNATAPDRGAHNCTAIGACAGNASCVAGGNGTHLRDRSGFGNLAETPDQHRIGLRNQTGPGNTTCTQATNQTRVRDRGSGLDRTGAPGASQTHLFRGQGR